MSETQMPTSYPSSTQPGDEQELFSDRFMEEHTDYTTWENFKLRLAATAPRERNRFVAEHTVFTSWREMEEVALKDLEFGRPDHHGGERDLQLLGYAVA